MPDFTARSAGWRKARRRWWRRPIARQHPQGAGKGTVFVTVEDEECDVQLILWPQVFQRHRRRLQSNIILARGTVSRRHGAATLVVSDLRAIDPRVPMPAAHDWR